MEYVLVKWVHVVSSTILFGTGIGSAFYCLAASLRRDPVAVHFVVKWVVVADWLFTAPSIVIQPLSGFYLVHLAGLPLSSRWIAWSIVLYAIAAACSITPGFFPQTLNNRSSCTSSTSDW